MRDYLITFRGEYYPSFMRGGLREDDDREEELGLTALLRGLMAYFSTLLARDSNLSGY
jgi:hypothetical protein